MQLRLLRGPDAHRALQAIRQSIQASVWLSDLDVWMHAKHIFRVLKVGPAHPKYAKIEDNVERIFAIETKMKLKQ